MFKKLLSQSAIYGLAPQITKLVSLFTLPIITQDLTEEDFGVAAVIGAYVGALAVFSTLGVQIVLVNSFYKSKGQYKWAWRQIYGFLNLWNIFYALCIGILLYIIIPDEAIENVFLIIFLNIAPLVFFGKLAQIGATYYQLKQQPIQIASRATIIGLMTIFLNVLFISHFKMGYMGWFWSSFIAGMTLNLSYVYPIIYKSNFKPIYNFKRRFIKNVLSISLPLIPHYYSSYLLETSDKMVMDFLGINTQQLGKYSVSGTGSGIVAAANNATGKAIGPMLMQCYKNKEYSKARKLIFSLQILVLALVFLMGIWMKEIFAYLIRNESLAQMYYLGVILIFSLAYRPMYLGFGAVFMYYEKTKSLFKLTFVAGLINVSLNLLLIPFFGFEVAAITTFIGYMYMGYVGYLFKGFRENNSLKYYPVFWLLTTIVLAISAYFIVEYALWIKISISVFFSLIVAFASYQLFNKK